MQAQQFDLLAGPKVPAEKNRVDRTRSSRCTSDAKFMTPEVRYIICVAEMCFCKLADNYERNCDVTHTWTIGMNE